MNYFGRGVAQLGVHAVLQALSNGQVYILYLSALEQIYPDAESLHPALAPSIPMGTLMN